MTTIGVRAVKAAAALQPFGLSLIAGRDGFLITDKPDDVNETALVFETMEEVEDFVFLRTHPEAKPAEPVKARKPRVSDLVHYVSHGSPVREDGTQAYKSLCRAAMVTEVTGDMVGLMVANPTGQFFNQGTRYDGGTFTGPEREAKPGEPLPLITCDDLTFEGGSWHWQDH